MIMLKIISPIKGIKMYLAKTPTINPNNPKAHNFFAKLISTLPFNLSL
jgi:hypothetical protein